MGTNIMAFFIGVATTYYIIGAFRMLQRNNTGSKRLKRIIGLVYLYWAIASCKDLLLTYPGMYTEKALDAILIADGWSALTFMAVLYELTRPGWVTIGRLSKAAIPFLIYTLSYILYPSHSLIAPVVVFLIGFGLYITIIGYKHSVKYLSYLHSYYSNIDMVDISWLQKLFWLAVAGLLGWLFTSLFPTKLTDCIYYLFSIAMWHFVYIHCSTLLQINESEVKTQKNAEEESRKHPIQYPFSGKMELLVETEQLYLIPDLTLDDLAKRLNTNRSYLSNYFSTVIKKPFYDYINDLRIKQKSIPMIKEHPEYTLDYISVKSGFNSLSTFRRAFRKTTGCTPREFRDTLN